MKEAYGGIFNILYISVFLVIVIGVLGLVVSYTKAFKMKSAIIATIEEYEGSGCFKNSGTACLKEIERQAKQIAYSPTDIQCPNNFTQSKFFCFQGKSVTKSSKPGKEYIVVTVLTQVDISFPIIEKIMGFRIFQVAGDTKEIQLPPNTDPEVIFHE